MSVCSLPMSALMLLAKPLIVRAAAARFMPRLALIVLVGAGASALGAGAANEVSTMRSEFVTALARSTVAALRTQAQELQALEKRAVAARDYDTAIAAREERRKMDASAAEQEKTVLLAAAAAKAASDVSSQQPIVLKPADAKLKNVTFDPEKSVLKDWKGSGASATWQLPNLSPGGYEVVLRYVSGALEGGTIVVQESFYNLSADLQTTGKGHTEQNIGTLRVRNGSGTLTLTARSILLNDLMQLESIELIPANR